MSLVKSIAMSAAVNGGSVVLLTYLINPDFPLKRRIKIGGVAFAISMLYDFAESFVSRGWKLFGITPGYWLMVTSRVAIVGTAIYLGVSSFVRMKAISEKEALVLAAGMAAASTLAYAPVREVLRVKSTAIGAGPGFQGLNSVAGFSFGPTSAH